MRSDSNVLPALSWLVKKKKNCLNKISTARHQHFFSFLFLKCALRASEYGSAVFADAEEISQVEGLCKRSNAKTLFLLMWNFSSLI